MDDARFDAITRAFTISRRTTGKTLFGAGLGLLLAGRRRDAAADCKKVGQGCDRSDDCCKDAKCRRGECKCKNGFTDCSGRCKNLNNNENHCGGCDDACPRPPATPNPHTCCSGTCRNLPTDENHCGACNAECPIGTYCDDGIGGILCRCFETDAPCEPDETCCTGGCVDLQDNQDHCGSCNNPCTNPELCTDGSCV
jgi:hypothetical protein